MRKTLIKKVSDNENIFLANRKRQTLKEHSIAVALYGRLLLKSLKFKDCFEKEIEEILIYSALLHDIGKISNGFQDYIKKKVKKSNLEDMPMDAEASRPKNFEGPFHNEISWAYVTNFIEFKNKDKNNIICHSIYWHHPANWSDKEDKLYFGNSESIFENLKEDVSKLLSEIHIFIEDLFSSFSNYYEDNFKGKDYLREPNKEEINEEKHCPHFFSHKIDKTYYNAKKQLCLNLLLEADRKVSSWELSQLREFLKKWETYSIPVHKTDKFFIKENLEENKKSKEQYNLANKMAEEKLSVCGIDPAGGKTSISLYWWHKCNNEYPLMIALPRQNQVTGIFKSLESDCERVYERKINTEAVFNGQRKNCNWKPEDTQDLLTSDINILVFDRFLSPYYKRKQSSEFLRMLKSHLILDEFHEFNSLPKMIPSLKEILTIRNWLESGVKTIMLSGTPEPSLLKLLCVDEKSVFKRENLSPRNEHKFKIVIKEKSLEQEQQFYPDCLYSFLRVDSCQKVFSQFFKTIKDKIQMIHSYFIGADKKKLLEDILQEHGKEQKSIISDKSVITSKMLQSSYNLSFNKAIVELSQPYMDCQTAGRINRFENKPEAEIQFFYNDKTKEFFNENKAGFKEIHKSWKQHILSFIEEHKNQTFSIRELMKSYDEFWNEENKQKSYDILKKKQKKTIEELNKYMPKRFVSGGKTKTSFLNSLFRGDSQYLSACVVDDRGQPTDQLKGEYLLSEGRGWLIQKINSVMKNYLNKSGKKCKKASKINNETVFEYNKHMKNFGFKVERPLLCSHVDNEVDKHLFRELRDEDNNSTAHRVYHKKFGLVKKDLLENE